MLSLISYAIIGVGKNKIYDTNEKVTSIVIPMLHEIKGMLIDMSAELNLNLDFGTLISNEENKE